MGLVDLLNKYYELNPESKKLLVYINDSAHELDRVIREIVSKTDNDKGLT
jgi:hypothetical protein